MDIKSVSVVYDGLIEKIREVAKDETRMNRLVKLIQYINDKNIDVLNTNIIGYSLLINERDQEAILDCLNIKQKDVIALCRQSPRLMSGTGIGKIIDQFSFAAPLLILSGELANLKKRELSQGVFLFTFYRPYASKITTFFRLGTVDEKAMEYLVTVELTDRTYLHKYGSVYATLVESAKSSYNAFIDDLMGKHGSPTDELLFNNLFYSSIFSKTGSWIKAIYGAYKDVKAAGKYLSYESSVYSSYDDDSGDDQYEENNINSDSAVKKQFVTRAFNKFNIAPIEQKLISAAAAFGNGGTSKVYESFLIQTINSMVETKANKIELFLDSIVGSFLDYDDGTGNKNTGKDITTIKFLAYSKKIIKTSNTINVNIKEEQNLLEEFLMDCGPKYSTCEIKTKRKMKSALYMYFVLFIQKA